MKFVRRGFSKYCFKPLYERKKDRLLSQRTLFIAFYQQKARKNEMVKQFGINTNKIYHEDFLKVNVLNPSTKGAAIICFGRARCSQSSISGKRAKMKYLSNLEEVLMKLIRKTLSKYLLETALQKEQRSAPFIEHPHHSLPSAKTQQK